MEIKIHTLDQLGGRPGSQNGAGRNAPVPLSPLRLNSYLHNPRASGSDPVLFEMHHKGRLIAYRTLLPDLLFETGGNAVRFAWLSGNYVDPEYRRQGISTRLLHRAVECWEGKLMYTNYAPASRAVYDRTGHFPVVARRPGRRFYLRSSLHELLLERRGSMRFLSTADRLLNRIQEKRLNRFRPAGETGCRVRRVGLPDAELIPLLDKLKETSIFRRDAEIFTWILEHPWVTDREAGPIDYHFSYLAKAFENRLLLFEDGETGERGLLWLVIHDRVCTAAYAYAEEDRIYPCMARMLVDVMVRHGQAYTTVRHPRLLKNLEPHRRWFLGSRRMPQLVFAHRSLAGSIPESPRMQDGDGDVVFTG